MVATAALDAVRITSWRSPSSETHPINGWIDLILAIVITPALYGYMQSVLNSAWRAVVAGAQPS
jgi:hypothetical protein